MSTHRIECVVNGEQHTLEVPSRRLLSDFLRDDLHLTGTKRGCETGIRGACSVLLDGDVVKSCLMLAVQVNGREITTIEGLAQADQLHPLQDSFMKCGGLQCGYCTPGMIMGVVRSAQARAATQCRSGTTRLVRKPVPLHRLYANRRFSHPRVAADGPGVNHGNR